MNDTSLFFAKTVASQLVLKLYCITSKTTIMTGAVASFHRNIFADCNKASYQVKNQIKAFVKKSMNNTVEEWCLTLVENF